MNKVKEFLKETVPVNKYHNRKPLYCKDGFNLSIQSSDFHYCKDGISVEIGFPSEEEELLKQYAQNKSNLTNTVYHHVPYDVVNKVIELHGGVDLFKTLFGNG
jgi:hypothetical protein